MRKRSECKCSCHVKVNGKPMAMHVMACCEPDDPNEFTKAEWDALERIMEDDR